jgi:hypothetical protein
LVNPPRTLAGSIVALVFLGLILFGIVVRWWKSTTAITGQEAAERAGKTRKYSLPADFNLDVAAERGTEGQIFIVGSTNLPDGTKLSIEVSPGQESEAGDSAVFVTNGHFRSAGFTKRNQPYSAGKYKVRVFCYFNQIWQNREVLAAVGEGGKNLQGGLFKLRF